MKNTLLTIKISLFIAIVFFACGQTSAQLLQWNTFGNAGTETTEPSVANDANISAASLTQGTITPAANGNRFGGSNWWNTGDSATNTLTQAIAGNDYIQFIVTPNSGYSFTPTSLVFSWDRSNTGPANVTLRSSVDGFAADLGSVTGMAAAITTGNTITISGLSNITTATTFRLYGYGASATGGTGGFDTSTSIVNVQLNGTTTLSYNKVSASSGDWNTPGTWTPFGVPAAGQTVLIQAGHTVYTSAAITRSTNTQVNGSFQIDTGGSVTGTAFTYGSASTLIFNSTANYGVNNTDPYWPSSSGPYNVTLNAGGITMNSASRTVNGNFNVNGTLGVNFTGGSALTMNGFCTIYAGGFFGNSGVIYGPASTLTYLTLGTYGRGYEWNALGVGTIGVTQGYPNNVTVGALTTLNYNNGTPLAKAMAGNLQISNGAIFNMNDGGGASGGALTVGGNVTIGLSGATMNLGNSAGDDLKIGGDFTNNGTFNGNGRAIWFTKSSGTQTIANLSASPLTIPYVVFDSAGSRTVALSSTTSLTISAPLGGNAISFGSAADVFSVTSSNTLTIGTSGVANTISGAGTFTFSSTSNFSILGLNGIGTINLTGGAQTLTNFTVNRTGTGPACTLGGNLSLTGTLALTSGRVDVGNYYLGLSSAASVTGVSSTNYISADLVNGTSAAVRKTITGTGSFTFPVGDSSGNYSPVTVTFPAGGSYSSAYASAAVRAIKHPNLDAPTDYINRYWDLKTSGITYGTFTTYSATGTYLQTDVMGTEGNCIGNTWAGSGWATGAAVNVAANTFVAACVPGATAQITAGYRGADIAITNPTPANQAHNSTYVFGAQPTGTNTDVTFTITNYGQQTLTFTSGIVSSSTAGVFTFNPAWSNTPSIAVGATRTFTIRFTPAAVASYTGSVTFVSNDPDESPYVINFTGSGVAAFKDINIKGLGQSINPPNTPTFLDDTKYVATNVGSPLAHTFTIENLGNIPLNISGSSIGGTNAGDFAITTAPATAVAASGTTTFVVTFTPTAAGLRSATVTVTSDDPDEATYTFNIEGTGNDREIEVYGNGNSIVNGDASPSTVDNTYFGNVNVASGTVVKNFTIFNTGALTLTLSSITITGAAAADFSITTSPTTSLATNTSTVMGITFNPSATGLRTALLTINNNDSNENPYTFVIQGNGVDYIPCALGANEVIAIQDFEASPATPTMTYATPTYESGALPPVVTNGVAYGSSRTMGATTNKFAGLRSYQYTGYSGSSTTEKMSTIEFDNVDVSAYEDITLSFKLGAYSTNNSQGPDSAEKMVLYISKDGGATWSQEIDVAGNSNSIWDINTSSGSVTFGYDGNNITSSYQVAATSTNTGPRTITVTNIPNSSQLKVKITFNLDRLDELWALDDVQFQGKKTATTTWQSPGAWSNGAPTSSVKAVINYPYNTSSGNIDACACQINATGSLTVNANQYADIQDGFDNNGSFTVESSGSLIQHNNAAVNTGNDVTIKRTTTPYRKFDYTYWSSPVTNANVGSTFTGWRTDYAFQFATANFQDLVTAATGLAPADGYDDDDNSWLNISPASTMVQGKGYAIMAPTNVTFSPTATATVTFSGPVNNGVITIPLAQSQNAADNNDDFNLIGNPYPSALSADTFITENAVNSSNITGALYFWTHVTPIAPIPGPSQYNFITADYAMYTLSGGTASATGSAQPTGKIASGEGFFVDAANSAVQATFNNSMRDKTYDNSQFFRMASVVAESQSSGYKDRIWLNFTHDNGLFSQQLLAYFPNTTLGYDAAYDGMVNLTQNSVSFYSFINDDKYRIQARPSFDINDVVPLGYNVLAPGTYHISIAQTEGVLADDNTPVYLEDRLLNIIHNLKESQYDFTTEAGTFDERFQLRYTNSALGIPDLNVDENAVAVAVSNGQIKVKSMGENISSIMLYDIPGRLVYEKRNIADSTFVINNAVKNRQTLIVKVALENGTVVNKKIIF